MISAFGHIAIRVILDAISADVEGYMLFDVAE